MFQRANAKLQDQVYGLQQKLKDQTDQTVNPEDLRQRLGAFTRALCTGQVSKEGQTTGGHQTFVSVIFKLKHFGTIIVVF